MKTIYSPNLVPGEDTITVCLYAYAPLRFARGGLAQAAEAVRRAGRFGDNLLVHINEREFEQLKKAWGDPHYNPETGLPEYFDWLGLAKAAIPIVSGLFTKKAAIDQANQNPAPPLDPNMSTHLGNFTNTRTRIPQPAASPSSYYTYGRNGGETQFFKNNSLPAVTGQYGSQVQPIRQSTPSMASMIGTTLAGTALDYALKNPEKVASWFGKGSPPVGADGKPIDTSMPAPDMSSLYGGLGAGSAGAGALPALDASPALHGAITTAELSPAEAYAAEMGALPEFGAGNLSALAAGSAGAGGATAAGGAGLLPGSTAGASMADTAAYAPSAIEASSPGVASSGLGATLGGAAAAVGLGVLGKHLQDNTAGIGYNYSRQLADFLSQNASAKDPTHGRGAQSSVPLSPPPPGFKSWTQYFAATQVVNQSMHAEGGAKDQGTYKMLLDEQGLPTDPSFYMQQYPGQDVAYNAIIGPQNAGAGNMRGRARGGRVDYAAGGAVNAGLPLPAAAMSPTQLGMYIPPPGTNGNMFMQPPPPPRASPVRMPGLMPLPQAPGALPPQTGLAPPPRIPPPMPAAAMSRPPMGGFQQGIYRRHPMYADGGHVDGPGSGRSDDIPARLSDGEYVIDAETTALLGDGSTKAGAAKLDHMRKQIRAHKGGALVKGRFTPAAKSPLDYMGEK